MDVIIEIVTFVATFIEAINIIISAIQFIFDLLITIFTNFFSIWNWITSTIYALYNFSQVVPAWLWAFPLAWISFRLIIFVKSLGGD